MRHAGLGLQPASRYSTSWRRSVIGAPFSCGGADMRNSLQRTAATYRPSRPSASHTGERRALVKPAGSSRGGVRPRAPTAHDKGPATAAAGPCIISGPGSGSGLEGGLVDLRQRDLVQLLIGLLLFFESLLEQLRDFIVP